MRTANQTLPLTELYRPIHNDLDIVKRRFDEELAGDLPFVEEMCDTIRSYRGKMLRPALLLLSAKASGQLTPAHHTLAAVVEMVHMATLVHDDVLDEADRRRRDADRPGPPRRDVGIPTLARRVRYLLCR